MGLFDNLFKSKEVKLLDSIISEMEMNMANNYKDNAQANLKEFAEILQSMKEGRNITDEVYSEYSGILEMYRNRMEGYSHKDQKPYWTKD